MASVVRMPSVLADATEAAIANWLVAPGDRVAVGDAMVEIETEKAIVEYQAEEAGIVGGLVLAAGEAGEVGAAMAVLIGEGETDADIDAALGGGAVAAAVMPAAANGRANGEAAGGGSGTRIFASPLVRKIALEKRIDLAGVSGTGPGGRIVRRDIERLEERWEDRRERIGASPEAAPSSAAARPWRGGVGRGAGPAAGVAAGDRLIPHTPAGGPSRRRPRARRPRRTSTCRPSAWLMS